jgi:hypothetical protein
MPAHSSGATPARSRLVGMVKEWLRDKRKVETGKQQTG